MYFDLIQKIVIEIPLVQIAILLLLCTVFALWGRLKIVLITVYGFMLYWVFFLNETKFARTQEMELLHTALFIITSIVFVGCSAWLLFIDR